MKKYLIIFVILIQSLIYSNSKSNYKNLNIYKLNPSTGIVDPEIILGHDFMLKKTTSTPHKFVMYFKIYNEYTDYQNFLVHGVYKDENKVKNFFTEKNLDDYYSREEYIQLENGEKFLYGKIIKNYNNSWTVKLELYYIDKNNEEKKKIFYKPLTTDIFTIYKNIEEEELEGYYPVGGFYEEITMLTENRIVHKKIYSLFSYEKDIYEDVLEVFKDEMPKEYFEYREKWRTHYETTRDKIMIKK